MCRIQNSSLTSDSHGEFPLADLTALMQPSKDAEVRSEVSAMLDMSKRIPVDSLTEKEYDCLTTDKGGVRAKTNYFCKKGKWDVRKIQPFAGNVFHLSTAVDEH